MRKVAVNMVSSFAERVVDGGMLPLAGARHIGLRTCLATVIRRACGCDG